MSQAIVIQISIFVVVVCTKNILELGNKYFQLSC